MTFSPPEPITYDPLTRTDFVRYAGASGDFNPLHHDLEFAKAAGLPDVMGHGMLSAGLLASAVVRWFGPDVMRCFAVRFLSPVWPDDVLTARCEIAAERDGENGKRLADLVLSLSRSVDDVVVTGTACVAINMEGERR
ncbi:MaoC/PaaZ C-terminal domain-containing protein [Mesorhizobium ephedrae]|uniref:MaoC-like domain-containing protein n=1 Tax=Kumtagia ephedrae TaxID=2116701 RepID=A0A2P7RVI5_9HYPH|nr:hypothetical protein C7I84_24800 [Mesorhizobium ephedrae]